MQYAFLLSGENLELAKEEILSLIDYKDYFPFDKLLIVDVSNKPKFNLLDITKRLALTKSICKVLFKCSCNNLIGTIKNYSWNSVYKNNFCVRIINLNNNSGINNKKQKFSEEKIAGIIWRKIKNPKVNLENPKTKIEFFVLENYAYCCLLIKDLKYDYDNRKSHLRPFPHPSSLHPRIARALINLTGIKKNEVLTDPFCGTGGFLIESCMMGIKSVGYDIDKEMAEGAKKNLRYFGISNCRIMKKDALSIKKADYVVTDLPYGLNSNLYLSAKKISLKSDKNNKKILESFYIAFLKRLKIILNKRAVVVFPDFVDCRKIIKKSKLKLKNEFDIYVHKSLTRKVFLLGK